MDFEHAVLCKIITDGDLTLPIELRITDEFFQDDQHLRVWKMINDHWSQYGTVITGPQVTAAYPTWVIYSYPDTLRAYVDELRDRHLHRILVTGVQEGFAEIDDGGPKPGERLATYLRETVSKAISDIPSGRDVDYFANFESGTLARLDDRIANPGMRGYHTGFSTLDFITQGWQRGQLVTITAVPKAGKSTLSLFAALTARQTARRVLYFTFEMSAEEQEDRLTSMVSGVDLNRIIHGELSKMERDKIVDSHAKVAYAYEGLTIVADTSNVTTVSAVKAKYRHYLPDLIIIDGVYLMDDENGETQGSPQALTNITRSLKRFALNERIPIVQTTQSLYSRSKGGVTTMESMGYSSSFGQDSDLILGADRLTDRITKFKVLGGRSVPKVDLFVEIDWTKGLIHEIDASEAEVLVNLPPDSGSDALQRRHQNFLMVD